MVEISVQEYPGLPQDCIISIRYGTARRQATLDAVMDRPLKFPSSLEAVNESLKIDVLQPIASTRLVLLNRDESYRIGFPDKDMAIGLNVRQTGCGDNADIVPEPPKVPFKFPDAAASAQSYFEKHGLLRYVQALLHAVIHVKPEDPYVFMMEQLGAAQSRSRPSSAFPPRKAEKEAPASPPAEPEKEPRPPTPLDEEVKAAPPPSPPAPTIESQKVDAAQIADVVVAPPVVEADPVIEIVAPPASPPPVELNAPPPTDAPPALPLTEETGQDGMSMPEKAAPFEDEIVEEEVAKDACELTFDIPFEGLDHSAFKNELLDSFRKCGANEATLAKYTINLRAGSVIAEVRGPTSSMSALKDLPLSNITVMGSQPKVTFVEKPVQVPTETPVDADGPPPPPPPPPPTPAVPKDGMALSEISEEAAKAVAPVGPISMGEQPPKEVPVEMPPPPPDVPKDVATPGPEASEEASKAVAPEETLPMVEEPEKEAAITEETIPVAPIESVPTETPQETLPPLPEMPKEEEILAEVPEQEHKATVPEGPPPVVEEPVKEAVVQKETSPLAPIEAAVPEDDLDSYRFNLRNVLEVACKNGKLAEAVQSVLPMISEATPTMEIPTSQPPPAPEGVKDKSCDAEAPAAEALKAATPVVDAGTTQAPADTELEDLRLRLRGALDEAPNLSPSEAVNNGEDAQEPNVEELKARVRKGLEDAAERGVFPATETQQAQTEELAHLYELQQQMKSALEEAANNGTLARSLGKLAGAGPVPIFPDPDKQKGPVVEEVANNSSLAENVDQATADNEELQKRLYSILEKAVNDGSLAKSLDKLPKQTATSSSPVKNAEPSLASGDEHLSELRDEMRSTLERAATSGALEKCLRDKFKAREGQNCQDSATKSCDDERLHSVKKKVRDLLENGCQSGALSSILETTKGPGSQVDDVTALKERVIAILESACETGEFCQALESLKRQENGDASTEELKTRMRALFENASNNGALYTVLDSLAKPPAEPPAEKLEQKASAPPVVDALPKEPVPTMLEEAPMQKAAPPLQHDEDANDLEPASIEELQSLRDTFSSMRKEGDHIRNKIGQLEEQLGELKTSNSHLKQLLQSTPAPSGKQ